MDITLIAIAIFILVAIVFLGLYLFKSINKKSFTAEDGSVFDNESDLDVYNKLYEKTKPLFSSNAEKGSAQSILGFEKSFITHCACSKVTSCSKTLSRAVWSSVTSPKPNHIGES